MLIVITFIFTSDPMAINVDPMAIADGDFPTSMVIFQHRCLLYDNQLNGESSMSIIDGEKSTSMSKDQQRLPDVVSTDVGIPTATIQLPMSIPAVEKSTSTLFPCLLK